MENSQPRCGGAEAVFNLQPSASISVGYHPSFGPHDDLILFELDEKIAAEVLHQRVTLRGRADEDAVLCTQSKTYAIKFVGTSNSVFLIPPLDHPRYCENSMDYEGEGDRVQVDAGVIKVASGSMELVEVAPRLDKLKLLLSENPYCSDEILEMEDCQDMERNLRGLYKWDDLVNKVQASDNELRAGLRACSAVEIDGYWRTVDEKYMDMVLRMLLHNSVLNDWSLDALDETDVVSLLEADGFRRKLASHCLSVYGSKLEGDPEKSMWKLDDKKVCIHFAKQVLRGGSKKMEIFLEEWMKKIPGGIGASFNMLEGEVLTENIGVETWVHAFSVSSLPSSPAERFSILFKRRPKWEGKDLQPFIRDLNVPGLSSEGLLLKYTRRTQPKPDVEPVFSAR